MLDLPTSPEKIIHFLDELNIHHEIHHHEAVHTVAESSKINKIIAGGHCRNLFLKDKKGRMALVTALDQTQIDLKALSKYLELGRFSFGSPERLWDNLGVKPGSVTPLALYNDTARAVRPVLDARMFNHEHICVHPLINTQTICFSPHDLLRFLEILKYKPIIVDMAELADD
jgi:Ala-tRNA(Pro) deacylase|tara:strand:+ start:229126 stop:229641 length:516 start_codon:yes stop_codon:yes gene_type:complete